MLLVAETIEEGYVNVFGEVQRLGCGGGVSAARMIREDARTERDPETSPENITTEQVEELRRLTRPPAVVQHTLEACFLILHASSASLPLAHPQWARVQKKLADVDFLQELLKYDAGHLRRAPLLTSYIASEYFGIELPDSCLGKSSKSRSLTRFGDRKVAIEPLTFSRVHRASQAAAALFKWCAVVLARAVATPPETLAEEETNIEVEPDAPIVLNATEDCVDELDYVVPVPPIEERESLSEPSLLEDKAEAFRKKIILRAWQKTCASLRPDRHFEELAVFCAGRSKVDKDNLLVLQNVAHAMRLRPSLQLQLMGCNDALEGEHASAARISSIRRFFIQHDIPASVEGKGRTATISYPAGIVCKLLLNEDRQLRDYFRALEEFRGRSNLIAVSNLLSFIATSFLENDAETLHVLTVTSQSFRNTFDIRDSIFPLLTVSDLLFSMWLEANFQTFLYT